MTIITGKSIDTLYAECKHVDRVLVPEGPLASALNRRIDQPRFGTFATTPRRLAAGRRERPEERDPFIEVIQNTELDWKEASFAVETILGCWEYRGAADAILEYEAFDTDTIHTALDSIRELDTTVRRLSQYAIDPASSIAVIGADEFSPLERSILPPAYEAIDPFTNDTFDPPPFRIFEDPSAIVDTVIGTATAENAGDIAVVVPGGSEYSHLVKSALEAAAIPYSGGSGFLDDPQHRIFLELLRSVFSGNETRVGALRGLLTGLGFSIDGTNDGKRLTCIDSEGVHWLESFREAMESGTFHTAIEQYEQRIDDRCETLRNQLQKFEILNERVTERAINRLVFALRTYEPPVEHENTGVLLTDPTASVYVDRPVVFYLGLDDHWTRSPPKRPWVDRETAIERAVRTFQRLLQNGHEQYYLVQDSAGGRPITPCLYFEELLDEEFERFSDLDAIHHSAPGWDPTGAGFPHDSVDVTSDQIDRVSNSKLKKYVQCPRDYFFARLLNTPENIYMKEGTAFHDFAEFYVNHHDIITEDTLDEIAELMADQTDPFLRAIDRSARETKYRYGIGTIADYLNENPATGDPALQSERKFGNFLADHYCHPVTAPFAECWFENHEIGICGVIDLIRSPRELLDFKSGQKRSPYTVVKDSSVDTPSGEPDFQALFYLTQARSVHPDETIQFTFFHFLESLDEQVIGTTEIDLDDCFTTVSYHPACYEKHITSPDIFIELQEDAPKDCNKTFDQTEYEVYQEFLQDHDFPETRKSEELIAAPFGQSLIERMRDEVGEYKYVTNGCEQALRYLMDIRNENYFAEDLDAFERFVQAQLREINDHLTGAERFPVAGIGGEPNYDRVDFRDCILDGEIR